MRTPFFGPFSVTRSTNLADNQLINLYPEVVEAKNGKEVGAFFGTPGLDLFTTVGGGPIRGMHVIDSTLYVVSGGNLYSVTAGGTVVNLGMLDSYPGRAPMIDTGKQLGIFSGAFFVLTLAGNAIAQPALPFTLLPGVGAYMDGFGLAAQQDSNLLWQSDLLNLQNWDALNFGSASGNAEPIVAMASIHRELFLIKNTVTEIWVNAGTQGLSFARLDPAYIEVGTNAAASVVHDGESLLWVGQNSKGAGFAVEVDGLRPRLISTHPISRVWQSFPDMSDAVAYGYQQDGHSFYVVNFTGGDETWVYDRTTSALTRQPMWHQRAAFASGAFHRHPGNVYVHFAGKNLVGDYLNGNLYEFNLAGLTDNGVQRKWLRSWRATQQSTDHPTKFASLRVDMQTGIDVPDGTNPQVVLRWSDDGGHIWSNERQMAAGRTGQTSWRVKANRLGATRRNSGLDRIFELSSTDQFPVALIAAELE